MLKTARDMVRRLGFVGAFLLALTTATLSVEAQPCAPDAEGTASALAATSKAVQSDPCAAQECRDCGLACAPSSGPAGRRRCSSRYPRTGVRACG